MHVTLKFVHPHKKFVTCSWENTQKNKNKNRINILVMPKTHLVHTSCRWRNMENILEKKKKKKAASDMFEWVTLFILTKFVLWKIFTES